MSEETIYVEVYLKKENNAYIRYEIEDKDDTILFYTFILMDCLHQFRSTEKEKNLFISPDKLKERLKILGKKFLFLPKE